MVLTCNLWDNVGKAVQHLQVMLKSIALLVVDEVGVDEAEDVVEIGRLEGRKLVFYLTPKGLFSSPGTTASAEKRRKTQKLEAIKKEMESLGVEVGDPHMESKMEPGEAGEKIRVLTNVYGVKMDEKWT